MTDRAPTAVRCPNCNAPPGRACYGHAYRARRAGSHPERVVAASCKHAKRILAADGRLRCVRCGLLFANDRRGDLDPILKAEKAARRL